jgi:hypothetical protein
MKDVSDRVADGALDSGALFAGCIKMKDDISDYLLKLGRSWEKLRLRYFPFPLPVDGKKLGTGFYCPPLNG